MLLLATQYTVWWHGYSRSGALYSPVTFFTVSFLLVYYVLPFAESLGIPSSAFGGRGVVNPELIGHGLNVSNVAASFFFLGYSFGRRKWRYHYDSISLMRSISLPDKVGGYQVLALVSILFYAVAGRTLLSGVYASKLFGVGTITAHASIAFFIATVVVAVIEALRLLRCYQPASLIDYLK